MEITYKIAHSADGHLRASQYASMNRGEDFTVAFIRMLDGCKEQGVDFLFYPGDILDTSRPSSGTMQDLKKIHKHACDIKLKIYLISGNHDRTNPHWATTFDATFDKNMGEVVRDTHTEAGYGFNVMDGKIFQVGHPNMPKIQCLGLPYMPDHKLLERLHETDTTGCQIVMWHGMLQEFVPFGDDKISVKDFMGTCPDLRMLLVGDIHVRKYDTYDTPSGSMIAGYPGSTELCSSSEDPNKSFEVFTVRVDDENNSFVIEEQQQIPIKTRPIYKAKLERIDQADDFVAALQGHSGDAPIVFVDYDPSLVDIRGRIRNVLPDDAILNARRISQKIEFMGALELGDDYELVDFLPHVIDEVAPEFDLAKSLLDESANVSATLDDYITRRMEEIKNETA